MNDSVDLQNDTPLPVADTTHTGTHSPKTSLGSTLRTVREQRGLSIADVAATIKFSPRQIEALETDDYAQLAGATFLRGMLRSYAKLLHLEDAPLFALLEPYAPQVKVVEPIPVDTGMAMPLPAGTHRYAQYLKPALLFLAGVAVVVATYLYWPEKSTSTAALPAARTPAETASVLPVAQPASPALLSVPDASGSAQVLPAPPLLSNVVTTANAQQLVFSFEGKSWVEVKDASKQVIFAQNNLPGARQVVSGKPPFEIVVGNAPAVKLLFGERPVDLVPHTRVDVARLTVE